MTLEQIKSEMLQDRLFSFKLRSVNRKPPMRAKCIAQASDTPTSQLGLLDELLKSFRCNVEIKIWIHFGIPAKSLKTEPKTRWIQIERTEGAEVPSARQIWREKCRDELIRSMDNIWADFSEIVTIVNPSDSGDAMLMTLCLNAAAFWSEREDNPKLVKDALGEPCDNSVKAVIDIMTPLIGKDACTSDSFCSGVAQSKRMQFLALVAEGGVEFGLEPIDGFVTEEAKARYFKNETDSPEDRAILEKIAGFCDGGIFAGDLYFQVETDLAISCNAGEPGQDYVKLAVTHGLIEEYFRGDDQCYRRVVEGGEQV